MQRCVCQNYSNDFCDRFITIIADVDAFAYVHTDAVIFQMLGKSIPILNIVCF